MMKQVKKDEKKAKKEIEILDPGVDLNLFEPFWRCCYFMFMIVRG